MSAQSASSWSISLCERPVRRGAFMDRLYLGSAMSHPFLVMKNDFGAVAGEVHGGWCERGASRRSSMSKAIKISLAVASLTGFEKEVAAVLDYLAPGKMPVNTIGPVKRFQYPRAVNEMVLVRAGKEDIERLWREVACAACILHNAKVPYIRYAGGHFSNCQSVLRLVMESAGLPVPERLSLAAPGWSSYYPATSFSAPQRA